MSRLGFVFQEGIVSEEEKSKGTSQRRIEFEILLLCPVPFETMLCL